MIVDITINANIGSASGGGASGEGDGEEEWVLRWVKGLKGQVLKSLMWFCFNWSAENAAGTKMVVCMLCKEDG